MGAGIAKEYAGRGFAARRGAGRQPAALGRRGAGRRAGCVGGRARGSRRKGCSRGRARRSDRGATPGGRVRKLGCWGDWCRRPLGNRWQAGGKAGVLERSCEGWLAGGLPPPQCCSRGSAAQWWEEGRVGRGLYCRGWQGAQPQADGASHDAGSRARMRVAARRRDCALLTWQQVWRRRAAPQGQRKGGGRRRRGVRGAQGEGGAPMRMAGAPRRPAGLQSRRPCARAAGRWPRRCTAACRWQRR